MNIEVVILAAGKGSRMYSASPKVLQKLAGTSLISRVVKTAQSVGARKPIVVTGYEAKQVEKHLHSENISFVKQKEQLGTAHAVSFAVPKLKTDSITQYKIEERSTISRRLIISDERMKLLLGIMKDDTVSVKKNVMFGIKDFYYPFFGSTSSTGGNTMDTLANCKNMTGDTTSCDAATKRGWYITLDKASKVTAEPTLARGVAYYPIFKPVRNNTECGSGVAYVCGIEAECGKNLSSELDPPNASSFGNRDCYKVGTGVLSKVVVFNNNLYANTVSYTHLTLPTNREV